MHLWIQSSQYRDTVLPPFFISQRVTCPKCRLGVTRIHDLSPADMKKVRQLALIDMTALSDLLELDVKRHKTGKRKMPGMSRQTAERVIVKTGSKT